jgi:hypothetical protein
LIGKAKNARYLGEGMAFLGGQILLKDAVSKYTSNLLASLPCLNKNDETM